MVTRNSIWISTRPLAPSNVGSSEIEIKTLVQEGVPRFEANASLHETALKPVALGEQQCSSDSLVIEPEEQQHESEPCIAEVDAGDDESFSTTIRTSARRVA